MVFGENTLEKQKNVCSIDQWNIKKITWQENGKCWVQLNIPKIAIEILICLDTKSEYGKPIKVLNRGRDDIVNTNSWKLLFRKINMVHYTVKYFLELLLAMLHLCGHSTKPVGLAEWLALLWFHIGRKSQLCDVSFI